MKTVRVILLITNKKLLTRFRLIPKSMTWNGRTAIYCTEVDSFGAHDRNMKEDRPIISASKM